MRQIQGRIGRGRGFCHSYARDRLLRASNFEPRASAAVWFLTPFNPKPDSDSPLPGSNQNQPQPDGWEHDVENVKVYVPPLRAARVSANDSFWRIRGIR